MKFKQKPSNVTIIGTDYKRHPYPEVDKWYLAFSDGKKRFYYLNAFKVVKEINLDTMKSIPNEDLDFAD